jgi:hypothetical protein
MIILDTHYAHVTFDKERELGMVAWKGKANSEDLLPSYSPPLAAPGPQFQHRILYRTPGSTLRVSNKNEARLLNSASQPN